MTHDPSEPISFMVGASRVTIGRFSYGYENIMVKQWNEGARLAIGSFCGFATVRVFLGGNHRTDWVSTYPFGRIYPEALPVTAPDGHPATNGDVIIGSDVWMGHNTTVMSGVEVGHGAVTAANSHVVGDVPAYSIVGGNPARVIRMRFDPETIGLLLALRWWELPVEFIRTLWMLSAPPDAEEIRGLIEIAHGMPRVAG